MAASVSVSAGLVLAAGAGSRYGEPKALVRTDGETWVRRAAGALRDGGCDPVFVTVGAAAAEVTAEVEGLATPVVVEDWASGMSASLRAGHAAVEASGAVSVVILLVDLPDVGAEVVGRLLARVGPGDERVLARAAYHGNPGHPVVMGRAHFGAALEGAGPDEGARAYLASAGVVLVECGDLASGRDLDQPPVSP